MSLEDNYSLKLEKLLVKSNVIRGTFDQLAKRQFNHEFNYRRLLLTTAHLVMGIRFMILVSFDNAKVCDILGDVFWTLGEMGFYMKILGFMVALFLAWYSFAIFYCEYRGQLGFLHELTLVTCRNSQFSVPLNAKVQLVYKLLVAAKVVIPYVNAPIVLALCTWLAYQVDCSIAQALYNTLCSVVFCIWAESLLTITLSVSVLVYLSSTLINLQLNTVYFYLQLCKDPYTLRRVLDEYTEIIVKVNKSNKFVKFVLGAVNFLAVPIVSILLNIINTPYVGFLFVKVAICIAAVLLVATLVSTSAFMASVHYKV